jgi:hypothetical protein
VLSVELTEEFGAPPAACIAAATWALARARDIFTGENKTMSEQDEQKSKLVIDEDWKSQVEAEREALRQKELAEEAAAKGKPDTESAPDEASAREPESNESSQSKSPPGETGPFQMPPATFPVLISSLATQAVMALGQMADPEEGQPVVRPEIARHYIDMLAVVEQKTKGNLTEEESKLLDGMLHELRMMYLAVQRQAPSNAPKPPQ